MATSSDGLLAPPPTTTKATKKTMNSPSSTSSDLASDSGRSSPNSSGSESPLSAFDHALDSTDPLSFLMNSVTNDMLLNGDPSTEDSIFSAPSSAHDSPLNDWPAPGSSKNPADMLWTQPDISSLNYFSNSMNLMNLPLGFDPMLFPTDPLIPSDPSAMGGTNPHALFPFAFNTGGFPDLSIPSPDTSSNRRHSSTSSTSSNSSLSPVVESSSAVPSTPVSIQSSPVNNTPSSPSPEQLMQELAQRAKQIVGLTVAMPIKPSQLGYAPKIHKLNTTPAPSVLPQQQQQQQLQNQPQSIDIPSQKPISPISQSSPVSPAPVLTTPTGKTKTSHTTIERRYRTNLNSRIQSLRAAVPALRVLEVKAGNRVGNLSLKAGTRRIGVDADATCDQEDVVDERGFVDGVKVARKGSKANVLGKAVEYIRVLKKRENRLKREQDGLKALIRSLVGGPELVQQWETMWRERFGGAEKDEVEGEDAEVDDDDDDDDMEDRDDDDASGKKRKRPKVEPTKQKSFGVREQTTQNVPIMPAQAIPGTMPVAVPPQTEKRKRGRPRKIPLPTMPSQALPIQNQYQVQNEDVKGDIKMEVDQTAIQEIQVQAQQPQSGQYLLAAFAFFSFFNSPVLSSWNSRPGSHAHTHQGVVLGDPRPAVNYGTPVFLGWRDVAQLVHLAVSVLLLVSVIAPWVPGIARYIPRAIKPLLGGAIVQQTRVGTSSCDSSDDEGVNNKEKDDWKARMVLLSALRRGRTLAPEMEVQVLREALELTTGVWGLFMSLTRQVGYNRKSRSRYGLERRMLEQRAFMRLAELVALDANAPITTRIQTYVYAFKFISIFSAPVTDITTLALIIRPVWRAKSVSLWNLALKRVRGKDTLSPHMYRQHEKFVLESMSIDEAAQRIESLGRDAVIRPLRNGNNNSFSELDSDSDSDYCEPTGPLAVLARHSIREYVRKNAERVFLQTVPDEDSIDQDTFASEMDTDPEAAEDEMRRTIAAGRALDQRTATLVDEFEQVCNPTSRYFASDSVSKIEHVPEQAHDDAAEAELNALLRAIVLYRRIFPSTLLSGDNRMEFACSGPAPSISLTPMPSPPPSPSRKDVVLHLELRHALDSSAFDRGHALEDARDRVVDMLTAESSGWPQRLRNL